MKTKKIAYAIIDDEENMCPIGDEYVDQDDLQGVPYRWINDDDKFEIFYNGKWYPAESIDFDFE